MIRTMKELMTEALSLGTSRLAVAVAQDKDVLQSVALAEETGLIEPILVGDREEITAIAAEIDFDLNGIRIEDEKEKTAACMKAAALIRDGEADVLMKGFVDTSVLLRAVLAKENELRGSKRVSHDLLLEIPGFDRLIHVTDSAMTIAPSLEDKTEIIRNAVKVATALGNSCPKVAVLCAVEKVNAKMPCTLDAEMLANMSDLGVINGCVVEGPLAMDNAVSPEAARHKNIGGVVAGNADILLVPTIEAGNILVKAAEYFAHAKKAGVIVGAKVPVALTSRASSAESKLYTIALACLIAKRHQEV